MKIALAVLCMLHAALSEAQTNSSSPTYRTCPTITSCESGIRPLTDVQRKELERLEQVLAPRASADAISKVYPLKPLSATPATEVSGAPWLGRVHMATWYTTDKQSSLLDPHVDVAFSNDGVAWFKWYFEGGIFSFVEVSYVQRK
jgi:hypothetical protein